MKFSTSQFAATLLGVLLSTAAAADTVLIRNATVHTMGSQGTLENTDILVTGNAIKDIGRSLNAPDGARIIDANGRPVTPGLFAGISAIGLEEVSAVTESVDNENDTPAMYPEFDVSLAYNPNSSLVPIARVEGHTLYRARRVDGWLHHRRPGPRGGPRWRL